ncbi:MAG: MBL fold metallo-hydrolase [Bacilli bacterium]|nr:MBL fold metallo-hydrolase [Bacilli bacterium]
MFFNIVGSGSKGNATLVFSKGTTLLIDMGVPLERLKAELNQYNKTEKDIDGVLVTHNHTDHIRGIKAFSPKKIYALAKTVPGSLSNVVSLFSPFYIGDMKITAFPTSHDAINPCGYIIEADGEKLVYMTDTGCYFSENTKYVKNPTFLIIESNHDIQKLLHTNRPMLLIQRIMSDVGHLCNEDSAFATLEIIGENTKEIILAHLSEEANEPELALEAYRKIFAYKGVDISRYNVRCAKQWESIIGGDYDN